MIALVDYGAGNLTSVKKALAAVGAEFRIPQSPDDLHDVRGVIVPGVGHFGATRAVTAEWRDAIRTATERGAALFGICLGMQWLFEGSAEAPDLPGLGVFPGLCVKIPAASEAADDATSPALLKVPHVGWNSLDVPEPSDLMAGVAPQAQVYFTHSYVAPVVAGTAAITTYGLPFSAAVQRGRIAGVQFHPEKSGDVGLRILKNWLHAL